MTSRTPSTALVTPLPPYRSPPSRSSTASNAPVEAPLGTAARAIVPSSRATSTSTVGFPRESRISRAPTASMLGTGSSLASPRHSDGVPRSAPRRFGTNSRSGAGPPVPLAAPAHEGDDGRDWTVHDLRLHVERYLLTEGTRLDTELLGTLVTDEDHLTVLVRYAGSHPVGHHVQSVHFDLSRSEERRVGKECRSRWSPYH